MPSYSILYDTPSVVYFTKGFRDYGEILAYEMVALEQFTTSLWEVGEHLLRCKYEITMRMYSYPFRYAAILLKYMLVTPMNK